MNKLKAAIIGSGLIAKLKHIPAFHKHRDKVHLAALCDVNIEAAQQAAIGMRSVCGVEVRMEEGVEVRKFIKE